MEFEALLGFDRSYESEIEKHTATKGTWIVEGYGATSDLDAQSHIINQDALNMGAEGLKKYNTVLFNHDPDKPIGHLEDVQSQPGKLFVKVAISKSEPKIWQQIQDGTLSKFSIRGRITDSEYQKDSLTQKEVMVIKGMDLHEVSLVSVPANVNARSLNYYIEKSMEDERIKENSITLKLDATELVDKLTGIIEKKTYKKPGESMSDCVSRKISENMKHGMDQKQATAAAYSMCGEHTKKDDEEVDKKAYPWEKCMADQKAKGFSEAKASKICAAIKNRTVAHMVDEWGMAESPEAAMKFIAAKMENDKLYDYAWGKFLELSDCGCSKSKDIDSIKKGIKELNKEQLMEVIDFLKDLIKGGQEMTDEEAKKAADEAAAKEAELKKAADEEAATKKDTDEKVTLDVSALRDVISQLQTLAKNVTSQSDAVKAVAEAAKKDGEAITKAKDEMAKMITDLNALVKDLPIRKGQEQEKDKRSQEDDVDDFTKKDSYKNAKPQDRLGVLLRVAQGVSE